MKLLLFLGLLFAVPILASSQDTIRTKGVFVSVRKQNPRNLLRFYPTSYIFYRDGRWLDDRGRVIPFRLVYRMEENDQLIAFDGRK